MWAKRFNLFYQNLCKNYTISSCVFTFKIHLGIFGLIASLIAHNIIILFGSILFSLRFLDLKYMKYNRKSAFEVLELGYAMFGGRLISSFIDPLFRIYLSKTAGLSSVGIFEISQKLIQHFLLYHFRHSQIYQLKL